MAADGKSVWLCDVGNEVSEILKRKLDSALEFREELSPQGPDHKRVERYGGAVTTPALGERPEIELTRHGVRHEAG